MSAENVAKETAAVMEQDSLTDAQRRALERAVVSAREVAERGARAAVNELGVGEAQPYDHLDAEERELRRRLRARARQLGDERQSDGTHGTDHLVREVAYEHWHRMLFARFLAENELLMHPGGVSVTLEECEELVEAEDVEDGWELAGRYAARMLPQIFRPDAPALELRLAPEYRQQLEDLLEELEPEIFTARDALGWVYQYWQSERKDEVNASEVKIGADELPAVTQLFTEPYMVNFLLENSLGAWWESGHPGDELPVEMPYLRHTEDGEPAAGTFDGWPDRTAELKVLDPCCGSGHFLVAALHLLVPMRMAEEGLSARAACDGVIRDNLYGLEIDQRCTEIAAFAVALAAWTYPGAEGYRELPEMHIACSGLSVGAKKEDWVAYAGEDERLQRGMRRLYDLFQDAPTLGSLIDPTRDNGDLFEAPYEELEPLLQRALEEEESDDYRAHEIGVTAQGLAKAADIMVNRYHLVTTNVPYLTRSKMQETMALRLKAEYSEASYDLATAFLERCCRFTSQCGRVANVVKQSFCYQDYYRSYRQALLERQSLNYIVWLGPRAFRGISGAVTTVCLLNISTSAPNADETLFSINLTDRQNAEDKRAGLLEGDHTWSRQQEFDDVPDQRILPAAIQATDQLLAEFVEFSNGIQTGDAKRFIRQFWEVENLESGWIRQQSTVRSTKLFGGLDRILLWEGAEGSLVEFIKRKVGENRISSWLRGTSLWGKQGVAVSSTGSIEASLYMGAAFDDSTMVLAVEDESLLPAIWSYCSSEEYEDGVRRLDRKLNVRSALKKVPFDVNKWQQVAEERYPEGLPEPYSEDPTQWIFEGTVMPSERPLQVAVARLLGYEWPEQVEDGLSEVTDEDGVVCIPPVRGEQPAASRLQEVLARAYGDEWEPGKTESLLSDVGFGSATLEEWLRDGFFEQHCDLFEHRPFIWHVWDGRKDGFGALVNYHELDRATLERLTYTYLGDWIHRQKKEVEQDRDAAEARLHAAQNLQEKLELILEGEKPYDIFVRWKQLEEQPIGWEPDLDDGVRQNIRPFVKAEVLRKRPNVKWTNDRGKEPEGSPWYEEFDGKRVNDHHLSLEEKKHARVETD